MMQRSAIRYVVRARTNLTLVPSEARRSILFSQRLDAYHVMRTHYRSRIGYHASLPELQSLNAPPTGFKVQ